MREEVALPPPASLPATWPASAPVDDSAPLAVLGAWHDAIAITGTHVSPIVAALAGDVAHCLEQPPASPAEVDAVFALSLAQLADPAHYRVEDRAVPYKSAGVTLQARSYQLPVFTAGPAPVWGLTAHMLDGLLREVLLPAAADTSVPGVPPAMPPFVVSDEPLVEVNV